MSAIYQRARPIRWDQVVGQDHVKDVLKAALEGGRVGHAYLFSGPRGVGKTTTARLIAMTANCTREGVKPCGECESCLSVRAGNHPDVLEIDAASNNSVDDVRELREKVGLSAMRGGKKIYILDEAHMMSRAAFNALLKTLEEPPGHVIFILATTEPEKIIPTILSRCQHYRFRRLTPGEIAGKLTGIASKEGVTAEPEALALIGRLADGAMRDGESLLERMLAAGGDVTRAGVEAALGLPPGEQMREMAAALVGGDAGGLLGGAARLYRDGYAARTVVDGLVTALGEALHAELGIDGAGAGRLEGAEVPRLLRLQAALDAQDSRFARGADLDSLELALTHALIAGDGVGSGTAGSSAQASGTAPSAELGQRLARLEKELRDLKAQGVRPAGQPVAQAVQSALDEIPAFDAAARAPVPRAAAPVPVAPATSGSWADVLRLTSSQTRAFLKPARMHAQQGYVSLSYDEKGSFHAKRVISSFDELGKLVVQVFGPVMLEIIGPTPDTSRKAQVGGRTSAAPEPVPEPVTVAAPTSPLPSPVTAAPVTASPAASPAASPPLPEPPPFVEARAQRASPAQAEARQPVVQPASAPVPEFRSQASAPAPAATPSARLRGSPDDLAPAPLPDPAPPVQEHVAVAPGPRPTVPEPEPIWQEPEWDDLGGEEPSTPEEAAAARPAGPATPGPADAASPATLQDLRAHPLYQEAVRLWPGRVREVGKLKRSEADGPETEDEALS